MTAGAPARMPRRRFLGMLAGAGLAVGFGVTGCAGTVERSGVLLTSRLPSPDRFRVPLPIPAVARPAGIESGRDLYEVTQRVARLEIMPGTTTEVWGFDGTFPGPTFDVRSGRPVTVRLANELPVPTSTHLHGGVTPADSDGYPMHLLVPDSIAGRFEPGQGSHMEHDPALWRLVEESTEHVYPLDQPAATLWYHDHRMDFTGPQVWRGLAGFFLVRDDVEDGLPLPRDERDVPLMICDRAFEEDGSFRYPALDSTLLDTPGVEGAYHQGVEGDVILVNGAPWPVLDVTNTRYRFRLLNASNARRYRLTLDPPPRQGSVFTQIGSDAGLLAAPQDVDVITLAGAERSDVLVDFSAYPMDTEVTLVNTLGTGPTGEIMRFRVTRRERDDTRVPARLADVETLTRGQAVARRRFDFRRTFETGQPGQMWTINGAPFNPTTALATPSLGSAELWTLTSDFHHPVHVHLGHFQVLTRNGGDPAPGDAGWKDTVDLRPFEVVQVLVRFTGFRGRYVMHCHNLEHEDMAMMANIDVV